jgi:peptidoglycan/LPS O-acetylase OafA/YrhL
MTDHWMGDILRVVGFALWLDTRGRKTQADKALWMWRSLGNLAQFETAHQTKREQIMKERRYDVDWLRVVATLAIFLFHCARFFDTEGWELKNAEQSFIVDVLRGGLIWPWVMELFFLLSGVGSWYALKSRTAGQYLFERVKRLLIPLYTVGVFLLLPPQFYFDLVTNEGFTGTFWEAMPHYLNRFSGFLSNLGRLFFRDPGLVFYVPFSGHLWFLQYLFLMSLAALPLLLYLKSEGGQRLIGRLAGWCDRRGGAFLFVIPIALALIVLRFRFPGDPTWADFVYYTIFFLIGYIMPADQRFTESFVRHRWVSLALWIVAFCGGTGFFTLVLEYQPGNEPFSMIYVIFQIILSILSWSAVVCMLSLGAKRLNFGHKRLAYANEAVLPFYLFHQTMILCVGWFVIRWGLGILPKYLIVVVVSFPLILLLYELFVRRFNVVRFFFGMRPRKKPPAPRPEEHIA